MISMFKDKRIMTNKLQLPKTNYLLAIAGNGYEQEHITWMDGYSDDDMYCYAEEVSNAKNAELQVEINRLRKRIAHLEKQNNDYSWITNPDRMGS